MLRNRPLLSFFLVFCFPLAAIAEDHPDPTSLFAKASTVSGLWKEGSAPNHMVVTFRAMQLTSGDLRGRFEKYWETPHHFRNEEAMGDFRTVLIRNDTALWKPTGFTFFPVHLRMLHTLVAGFQIDLHDFTNFKRVRGEKIMGRPAECTERNSEGYKAKYCFDAETGVLLQREQHYGPVRSETSLIEEFSDYTSFGSKLYPRKMTMTRNGKRLIEATIESIEAWSPSPELLAPNQTFEPHTVCDVGRHIISPSIKNEETPRYPAGEFGNKSVGLHLLLNEKGEVAVSEVSITAGKVFDDRAEESVRKWKFTPATCDGKPVEAEMDVQFNFHK